MNIQHISTMRERREASMVTGRDRLFSLSWDNSKLRIDPRERYKKREARGVHFSPEHAAEYGIAICLNNGNSFTTMSELEHHLEVAGKYEIVYDDEVNSDG